ncbi:MAG: carbon storage regulator [Planctomycetota bacterium]
MLVFNRKPKQSIVIDDRVFIEVLEINGSVVRLGVIAPVDMPVHRQEVLTRTRDYSQYDEVTR